ncbi:hypothetical protein ACVWW1_008737 [Bradyrhizobium sp. JR3.5]
MIKEQSPQRSVIVTDRHFLQPPIGAPYRLCAYEKGPIFNNICAAGFVHNQLISSPCMYTTTYSFDASITRKPLLSSFGPLSIYDVMDIWSAWADRNSRHRRACRAARSIRRLPVTLGHLPTAVNKQSEETVPGVHRRNNDPSRLLMTIRASTVASQKVHLRRAFRGVSSPYADTWADRRFRVPNPSG